MKQTTIILALLIAMASPAKARPFQWRVKKGQRFAVQWRSSDWRQMPHQTEVKAAVDMDWHAEETILETGHLTVTLKKIRWSYENSSFKLSMDWRSGSPIKTTLKDKDDWSPEDSANIAAFKRSMDELTKTPLILRLQSNGRYQLLPAASATDPSQAPTLLPFASLLPLPDSVPLDLEHHRPGAIPLERLPAFFSSKPKPETTLPYSIIPGEGGKIILFTDQKRPSARSFKRWSGFLCNPSAFEYTVHERCLSQLKIRHEFGDGFLNHSELNLTTERSETEEYPSGKRRNAQGKPCEWVRLSTSLKVQAR